MQSGQAKAKTVSKKIDFKKIFADIEELQCLREMVRYYQYINRSIRHLAGDKAYAPEHFLARMSVDQIRDVRRYINGDLEHLSIEFYLQRVSWALKCHKRPPHQREAAENPSKHPCMMKGGFNQIVLSGKVVYTYEEFLGETLPIFVAIHNHLASINRALGNLYYYVTEVPFSSFTPTGKTEILHLTKELERLMRGLLVATHLQRSYSWQTDLLNYLISCRSDCFRFLETFPRYYQNHRMRLVIFPIDPVSSENDPYGRRDQPFHALPLACVPWSAGTYLDFLDSYQAIVHHLMAVIAWSIRLYSLWYFVPRRFLRLIAPTQQQ